MSKEEIGKSIAALHAEIEQLDTPDAAVKEKLLALIDGMEQQLQDPDSLEHKAATERQLPGLIEQFEVDHPQMTATLSRLLTTLSGMGI